MSGYQIVQQITLPDEQDADAFETFMRDEYFPAVHKGPTRVGQVTSLALLRGVAATHARTATFLMVVGYAGLAQGRARVEDEEVVATFESFGATVEPLGVYDEVARWDEGSELTLAD